jgi:hypothetical protein
LVLVLVVVLVARRVLLLAFLVDLGVGRMHLLKEEKEILLLLEALLLLVTLTIAQEVTGFPEKTVTGKTVPILMEKTVLILTLGLILPIIQLLLIAIRGHKEEDKSVLRFLRILKELARLG